MKLSPPENTAGELDRQIERMRGERGEWNVAIKGEKEREMMNHGQKKDERCARALDDAPAFKPIVSHLTSLLSPQNNTRVAFHFVKYYFSIIYFGVTSYQWQDTGTQ